MNKLTAHSVCLLGADAALTARIRALLDEHATHLDAHWQQADQASADLLLIDPDSVYGHMDWLRAQSSGRPIVACTHAPEAFASAPHLRKPIVATEFVAVLNRIGATLRSTPAPAVAPRPAPAPVAAKPAPPAAPAAPVAPKVEAAAPAPPRALTLLDLLGDDSPTSGKIRLSAANLPQLYIDPQSRQWHADATLKTLGAWCTRELTPSDLQQIGDGEFSSAVASLPANPHARLTWLAHLVGGAGQLDQHLDPADRFKLARWPQSEREFPKHFRIATVMLKQAASIDDIAAQSGASFADVADFVNAYHALGFVEVETQEKPVEEARRGGLFARARKNLTN